MMPFPRNLLVVSAVLVSVTAAACGQQSLSTRGGSADPAYDSWSAPRDRGTRPISSARELDFPEVSSPLGARERSGQGRLRFSEYGANGRSELSRSGRDLDWRSPSAGSGSPLRDEGFVEDALAGPAFLTRLSDPFRSRSGDSLGNRTDPQIRYRVPLDRVTRGSEFGSDGFDSRLPLESGRSDFRIQSRSDSLRGTNDAYGNDVYDNGGFSDRLPSRDGRDPFVPAPLPRGRIDDEAKSIDELISARYQNPVNVRALRAMTSDQALKLFAEVSQKIDERHVEPSTYDLRVRRALRNLTIALDNPVFTQSLGIAVDSFRADGFRNSLSGIAESMQVSGYQDARNVLTKVMQSAQSVTGLTPSVVAFEFANASLDTLDKFSGLEPSEPGRSPGAEAGTGHKTAALEEEIVGVGVEVKVHTEGLLVVKALRGSPAAEAGLQAGDMVIAIDGRNIRGMPMANSVDLMKGSAGSRMTLRIYRAEKGERDFVLTRRKVRVWTVNDTRLIPEGKVGYLSLSRFAQNSTAELDQALMELHNNGMESLVIDLRGNPGGLLTTCVEISDRFVPCGVIVSTKGRLSGDNMVERANFSKTWKTPLVVLVDGDSASASEIFAAAIQENGRGVVVGMKSYGKGTVQTHFPLGAISGNLRLTTAKFFSPNGRAMSGQGVTPDVVVNDPDGVENGDKVLAEALRIARSPRLQEMAQAAAICRPGTPSAGRSSSLDNFNDSLPTTVTVR